MNSNIQGAHIFFECTLDYCFPFCWKIEVFVSLIFSISEQALSFSLQERPETTSDKNYEIPKDFNYRFFQQAKDIVGLIIQVVLLPKKYRLKLTIFNFEVCLNIRSFSLCGCAFPKKKKSKFQEAVDFSLCCVSILRSQLN